jgi:hypothetical protein
VVGAHLLPACWPPRRAGDGGSRLPAGQDFGRPTLGPRCATRGGMISAQVLSCFVQCCPLLARGCHDILEYVGFCPSRLPLAAARPTIPVGREQAATRAVASWLARLAQPWERLGEGAVRAWVGKAAPATAGRRARALAQPAPLGAPHQRQRSQTA